MKKDQIKVGGLYKASVNGKIVTVRVDSIREGTGINRNQTSYNVTNLSTGRRTVFRSSMKFRSEAAGDGSLSDYRKSEKKRLEESTANVKRMEGEQSADPTTVPSAEETLEDTTSVPATVLTAATIRSGDTVYRNGNPNPWTVHSVVGTRANLIDSEGRLLPAVCVDSISLTSPSFGRIDTEAVREVYPESRRIVPALKDVLDGLPEGLVTVLPGKGSGATAHTAVAANPSLADRLRKAAGESKARTVAQAATPVSGRAVGDVVAGMIPNEEQELILAAAGQEGLKVLVVGAGAGTGKTATLKMLEQVLRGNGQYTAFNSSLVAESKGKFVKASCNTTHSLAFRAVGCRFKHRLGGERMRSSQVARILGIEDMQVQVPGQVDSDGAPKPKTLKAEFLAGQVLVAIRKFCQSADDQITAAHIRYIDGIDGSEVRADGSSARKYDNNELVRDYLLPFCRTAWADLSKEDGTLPFSHDVYVKLWQLGKGKDRPVIAADYILLDEAQDTAPVFLDILQQQTHALLVLVGDDNQQIYEWRGAVNAMASFPGAPRCLLSQSYRFGQAIADVANAVLATLEEKTDLVMRGMPGMPSRVDSVESPRCFLYRTNAGAIGRVMRSIADEKKPHLIGGGADVVAWCQAAMDLQAKKGTRHPELCCFNDWNEVVEYSKTDEGDDLALMVKLVEDFGAEEIRDALKDMPSEEEADLVVSTAHKSKGREWDTVRLGSDFPTANKMNDAARRLLYVAATRAKLTLDISECPPFCGGESRDAQTGNSGRPVSTWIPGLKITYTGPMPTEEELEAWKADRVAKEAEKPVASSVTATAVFSAGTFSWYNYDGKWCIKGPTDVKAGTTVKVTKKNGQVATAVVKTVVKKFSDNWIYGV